MTKDIQPPELKNVDVNGITTVIMPDGGMAAGAAVVFQLDMDGQQSTVTVGLSLSVESQESVAALELRFLDAASALLSSLAAQGTDAVRATYERSRRDDVRAQIL